LFVERPPALPEQARGERAVPLGSLQRVLERLLLRLAHAVVELRRGRSRRGARGSALLRDDRRLSTELALHVRGGDRRVVGEHDHALDEVLQLPHVAGPLLRAQARHRLRLEANARAMHRAALRCGELRDERVDVLRPRAERRHGERNHGEPIVQVLAERPLRDHRREVAVRRGGEPDVHLERLRPAEPLDLALLEHAEELHLRRGRDVADLVQEQRAALRELHAPRLAADGARERALLVAEELALEERVGERASKKPLGSRVDRHEHIGEGDLGKWLFWRLVNDPRFATIPGVLEAEPASEEHPHRDEVALLRSFVGAPEPKYGAPPFALAVQEATPARKSSSSRRRPR
jgi:hypothetical protein